MDVLIGGVCSVPGVTMDGGEGMPERQRIHIPRRSMYVRRNMTRDGLLAVLVVMFVAICVFVLGNTFAPDTGKWADNVLIRMIVETNQFVRGRGK
jgi:hypothetical protein